MSEPDELITVPKKDVVRMVQALCFFSYLVGLGTAWLVTALLGE